MYYVLDIPLKLTSQHLHSSLEIPIIKHLLTKPSNSTFFKDETQKQWHHDYSWKTCMHVQVEIRKYGKKTGIYNENRDWNNRRTFNLLQCRLTGFLASKLKWVVACSHTVTFTLPINDVTARNQVFIAWLKAQELVVIPVFIWTGTETEAFISEDITARNS